MSKCGPGEERCRVRNYGGHGERSEYEIEYCPRHEAVGELVEALRCVVWDGGPENAPPISVPETLYYKWEALLKRLGEDA